MLNMARRREVGTPIATEDLHFVGRGIEVVQHLLLSTAMIETMAEVEIGTVTEIVIGTAIETPTGTGTEIAIDGEADIATEIVNGTAIEIVNGTAIETPTGTGTEIAIDGEVDIETEIVGDILDAFLCLYISLSLSLCV